METAVRQLLAQMSRSIDEARTLEALARPLLDMLQSLTGLESVFLTSVDTQGDRQRVRFVRNAGGLRIEEGMTASWRDAPCRRAMDEGRTQVDDAAERWGDIDLVRMLDLRTFVSVPVRTGDGALYGTLCACSRERHVLDGEAEQVLRLVASLLGQHVERERLAARLARLEAERTAIALADPLTGLPNRRALSLELSRMLARVQRDDRALVVAFIHLDDVAAINERHGHDAGDRFLAAVARALDATLRGGDLLARVGGDVFVVAGTVPRESADAAGDVLRDRLQAAMHARFDLGGGVAIEHAGARVGLVLARPGEIDAEAVLARGVGAGGSASGAAR